MNLSLKLLTKCQVDPMTKEEYAAAIKEYDPELALEQTMDQSPTTQQVFATMTELGGGLHEANKDGTHAEAGAGQEVENPADAARVMPPPPLIPPPQLQQEFPPGTSTAPNPFQTPEDKMFGTLLATPITLDHVKEVTKFDGMWKELLQEAKCIAEASAKLN
jgi:hypothetical protein